MAGSSPEEIKKSVRQFFIVGMCLFVGTVLTVAVAYVPWLDFGAHGFDTADVIVGLGIATVKASLVGLIFMHLSNEKKLIYWSFFGAIFFAVVMVGLIAFGEYDPIIFEGMLDEGSSMPAGAKRQL